MLLVYMLCLRGVVLPLLLIDLLGLVGIILCLSVCGVRTALNY